MTLNDLKKDFQFGKTEEQILEMLKDKPKKKVDEVGVINGNITNEDMWAVTTPAYRWANIYSGVTVNTEETASFRLTGVTA